MKTLPIFAALALFATSTGVAHAAATPQVPVLVTSDLDGRVDKALADFRARASTAGATLTDPAVKAAYDELIASIRAAYAAMANATPNTATIRTRLTEAINDIMTRAQKIAISQAEFNALQVDILNHRVRNAVNQAMANYKAGTATADDLRRIQQAMVAAADAGKADLPELSELRDRLQTRIDALNKRGNILATDLVPIDQDVAATSVKVWAHVLQNHTLAGIQTETDWLRPKYSLNDDVVVAGSPANLVDIQKRLLRILDGLKAKVSPTGNNLSTSDFDDLKAQITAYARAALGA